MRPADHADASHDSRSLGDWFRRAAGRVPAALALVDPPDRADFTDGPARRLTYAAAERAIEATAARLRQLGLQPGSIVALQMPNIAESVIALLGVLRAGLIPAPMPLLWRQADAVAALGRLAPRALITVRRLGEIDHASIAMQIAAEIFTVRFVCGFGADLPDGVIGLDEVFGEPIDARTFSERTSTAPGEVAALTFDVTARGIVPVPHTHAQLVAAGNAIVAAAELQPGGTTVAALATASFAGIASVIMPWLITGGTLALHHSFSPEAFLLQLNDERCASAVVPAAILPALEAAGLLRHASALDRMLAVWRSPEFLAAAPAWPDSAPDCVDVAAFGEVGVVPQRRGPDGLPARIPLGALGCQRAIEVARTATGTLAIRGPMVPAVATPGHAPSDPAVLKIDAEGFVDTEYPCRLDRDGNSVIVSGPPAGLINVGGYRFAWRELQEVLAALGEGGSFAALPDRLAGHRLAGVAADAERVQRALLARGVNPLLIAAFRDRR